MAVKKGSWNPQQIAKNESVMSLFKADPGHVLIDSDLNSVEPRVVAFFSRDKALLELYASGKAHDVYLFVAIAIFPEIAEQIRAVYYLPDGRTTKESIKRAKEQFSKYRKIAKSVNLACGYGASAWKIWQTCNAAGIKLSFEEAERLHKLYWQLFAGVAAWGRALRREWQENGGWILNGRGRPLPIPMHREKDLPNAFAQSTGHDCLMTLVYHINRLRKERSVPMRPWFVDLHDETIWQVPEQYKDAATQIFKDAYQLLNSELSADVPLVGDIDIGATLWEFKNG